MSEPFLAEVRMFGFNFPPRGWASVMDRLLPINQNQSLFSLLGTTMVVMAEQTLPYLIFEGVRLCMSVPHE